MLRAVALALMVPLAGCVFVPFDPGPGPRPTPIAPAPNPAPAPTVNGVPVTLTDGSRGLALWCAVPGDCIADTRTACNGRQSIRTSSDIDRSAAGAAEFFARAETEPSTLVVACS